MSAADILNLLNRLQRHQNSNDADKLEAAVADLTAALDALQSLPKEERNTILRTLADNRWQLDTIISTLEASQSALRQKLLKQRTAQTAQSSYGQYNK